MKRHFRKWGLGLCALLTAVLIGCQAVAGVDLNQAIISQLEVTSLEQSGSMTLNIDWNEDLMNEMDPQAAPLIAMLSKVDLRIAHAATDDQGRISVTGTLGLAGKSPVAFTMHFDGTMLRLDVSGAKRPLVVDLGELTGQVPQDGGLLPGAEMQQQIKAIVRQAATYFVKHLPNPGNLDVSRVVSDVNGENIALTQIHAELDGEQLGDLLETYVNSLVQDKDGLRQMLKDIVQWAAGLPPELAQELTGEEIGEIPAGEDLAAAVDEGFEEIYTSLQELQTELADWKKQPESVYVFDKGITFKTDLYLDDQLRVRKSDAEIVLEPFIFSMPSSPVRSITIQTHAEMWNVNGKVEIPPVEKPLNAIGLEQLGGLSSVQFVRLFEEDSAIHDILKNDLQIDDADFELGGWSWYDDDMSSYITGEGSSEMLYVSLRQTLDGFEDTVSFTPKTRELRFYDPGTWQEIVLHVGSADAMVNGETVALGGPVELHNGYTFVPADDLFKLLQAEYEVQKDEDGYIIVTVSRDL